MEAECNLCQTLVLFMFQSMNPLVRVAEGDR